MKCILKTVVMLIDVSEHPACASAAAADVTASILTENMRKYHGHSALIDWQYQHEELVEISDDYRPDEDDFPHGKGEN